MPENSMRTAVLVAILILVSGAAATMVVTSSTTGVAIDASPTDISDAESTHTVVFTVGDSAGSAGDKFNRIKIDYTNGPSADVSNVGVDTIERIGIDRNGDNIGTRIDESAKVNSVTGICDGKCVDISTNGELTLNAGDEVVVVLRPVQNPQNGGSPEVNVVLNGQGAADTATDAVTYEDNNADVTLNNKESDGNSIIVDSVTLSEAGWVVISDTGSADPDAIRGSKYLGPGTHSDVKVNLDEPIQSDTEVYAQAHLDTNGDRRFDFQTTGGSVDELYRNSDGNIQTDGGSGGSAQITKVESTQTSTPTATSTPTPPPTTPTPSDTTPTPPPTTPTPSDTTPTPPPTTPTPSDTTPTPPPTTPTPSDTTPTPSPTASPTTPCDDGSRDSSSAIGSSISIEEDVLKPGEKTEINVGIDCSEPDNFTILHNIGVAVGGENLRIVSDDSATYSETKSSGEAIFATYTERSQATLTYEIEVPESLEHGNEIQIASDPASDINTDTASINVITVSKTYAGSDGEVSNQELIQAINDWRGNEISNQELIDIINAWRIDN